MHVLMSICFNFNSTSTGLGWNQSSVGAVDSVFCFHLTLGTAIREHAQRKFRRFATSLEANEASTDIKLKKERFCCPLKSQFPLSLTHGFQF